MYVGAAASAARLGPGAVRRLLDSGKPGAHLAVAAVAVVMLCLCATGAVIAAVVGLPWLVLLFALPMCGACQWLIAIAAHRTAAGAHRGGDGRPQVLTSPSGKPATGWHRHPAALWVPSARPWVLAAAFGAPAATAYASGSVILASVLFTIAVGAALHAWPHLRGQVDPGGLYLTPAGVEHHFGVTTSSAAWERVGRVTARNEAPLIVVSHGATVQQHSRWRVLVEVVDRTKGDVVAVPASFLPLDARRLAAVLNRYRDQPDLRAHLGTAESTHWLIEPPAAL